MTAPRILLAEDNPDHLLLTSEALASLGTELELRVARDGQEAVDILLGERWQPALLLLDLQLPLLDGFEVLERLQADDELRLLPVVLLTSSSDDRDVVRAYALGSTNFVTKPVSAQVLAELVSRLPSPQASGQPAHWS